MKSGNIDDVVSKVLNECSPSASRNVTVALSLSEVQLFLSKKPNMSPEREREQEKILSHETSRVRLTGVFSEDRRFCGYIIKEVGKPQEGHVIRCNSAALMMSFTSFLRQSCQLTSPQRGASFYDEISTDESDDWDCSSEVKIHTFNPSPTPFFFYPSSQGCVCMCCVCRGEGGG